MKTTRLLIYALLIDLISMPWALAQDTIGIETQGPPGQPSSISPGSYGTGFYSPGLTGPGSYGPGSYGPGSYGPQVGGTTGPPTPFTDFSQGGAAAGTPAVPSARPR